MSGREDWYSIISNTPKLSNLQHYIDEAIKHLTLRHEPITPSKIIAELTFGFWVSLLNSEYERILWKHLRKAFSNMPRHDRKRRNISTPLNMFRHFRNRIFHNEPIYWNLNRIIEIHSEMLKVIGWMDKDLPQWVRDQERFENVCDEIKHMNNNGE